MGTTIVKPCKKGSNLDSLTDKRRIFVLEYLADSSYDAAKAARKAGYKHPQQAANKLMNDKKIAAIIGKHQRLREEKLEFGGDSLFKYMISILELNPFDYFILSENGYWVISDPKKLPAKVAQFVEAFELEETVSLSGRKDYRYKVKLISKTAVLALMVKVQTVDKHEHKVEHSMDWDSIFTKGEKEINIVEARLIEEEKKK